MLRQPLRILITGGLGFIGKSLAVELIKSGYTVTILDGRAATDSEKSALAGAKIILGDVTNSQDWAKLDRVDVIYHFAAPASIISFKANLAECVKITLTGLINAFNWAENQNITRLIYPSSGSIFGGSQTASDETTLPNPPNVYGQTKLACEAIAKIYESTVPSLGLRIFAGFGPQEAQKGKIASVVTLFFEEMKLGRSPVIFGDGSQTRDFVYIDDVVETLAKVLESDLIGVLNVGSGEAISFNQLVSELNRQLKTKIKPEYVARPTSYLDSTLCNPKKLVKVLGRKPLTFSQALTKYFQALAETKEI